MTDKQPEALRLAHALCNAGLVGAPLDSEVAAELHRQHALIAELVQALQAYMTGMPTLSDEDRARAALSKAKEQQ